MLKFEIREKKKTLDLRVQRRENRKGIAISKQIENLMSFKLGDKNQVKKGLQKIKNVTFVALKRGSSCK